MAGALVSAQRARGRRIYRPLSDINVTPMVDVMLVLLIVFMVTAPLLTSGVEVDLPKTEAAQLMDQKEPLIVSINAEGKVFLGDTEFDLGALPPKLSAVLSNKPDTVLYVRGDKAVDYGRVLQVMGGLTSAGFKKVALVVDADQAPPARPAQRRAAR